MTETTEGGPIPKLLIGGAVGLVGFCLLAVTIGRTERIGLTEMPPANVVRTLAFQADDRPDGSIELHEAGSGGLVATVRPGEDNFIRATLRGFGQARLRAGLTREQPFRLTRFDDGSLTLDDALTGRTVNLGAFGPTNSQAFARLMPDIAGTVR